MALGRSIPATRAADGDPLDVLVLGLAPTFPVCLVTVRLIGVVHAEQTEGGRRIRNDRLIAVAETPVNRSQVKELSELDPEMLRDIEHFFESYNRREGRRFRICGRGSRRAAEALLERNFEIIPQIAAAARPVLAAPAAAHKFAEHLVEDIGEAAGKAEIAGSSRTALLKCSMTEAIVGGTPLIVLQDVIRLIDTFEFAFRIFITRIAVGVILHRELAVGSLQVVGAGGSGDAEDLVKILLCHRRRVLAS